MKVKTLVKLFYICMIMYFLKFCRLIKGINLNIKHYISLMKNVIHWAVVANAFKPSTREAEAGESL